MVEKSMKRFFVSLVLVFSFVAARVAFAQDASSLPTDLDPGDALKQLLAALGGLKGATALGIVGVVVQAIMLFFRTQLANFSGKWRLTIVVAANLLGGLLALKLTGISWSAALLHSNTFAAVQVLLHQVYKQFTEQVEPQILK